MIDLTLGMSKRKKDILDAIIILDNHNQIIGVNPMGEKLLRMKQADMIGKSVDLIFPRQSTTAYRKEVLSDGRKEASLSRSDGKAFYVELMVTNIMGVDDSLIKRVLTLRDNSQAQQSAMQAQQAQVFMSHNAMLQALQDTTFDLHSSLDLDVVLSNIVARACSLLGTPHGYLDIINDADQMIPVVGVGELKESLKFQVVKGEGVAGTVWQTGKPLVINDYDKWGCRIKKFPQSAIQAIVGMPLILKNQVVGVIGVARGADKDASFTEDDVSVLQRFASLAAVALENARLFREAQKEIEFRRETEVELRNANQILQLQIERVEHLQKQLQELAVRDPLTALYNRRYLQDILDQEFFSSEHSSLNQAILMMDTDCLKEINDKYGHKAGDEFLIRIADVIKHNINIDDIACRFGGDEYVVVIKNVSLEIASQKAEILRKRISTQSIVHGTEPVSISVSIGVAMFPEHGLLGEELLQKADLALYEAKRMGKNRVVVFNDETNN